MIDAFEELLNGVDLKVVMNSHHDLSDSFDAGHNVGRAVWLVLQGVGREEDVACLPADRALQISLVHIFAFFFEAFIVEDMVAGGERGSLHSTT